LRTVRLHQPLSFPQLPETSASRLNSAHLLPHGFTNRSEAVTVKIVPNDKGTPPGKLADAELHFQDGPLEGLKLIGFGVWERKNGQGRNVTFPARSFAVGGERRSFALLRPITDSTAQNRIRDVVLKAYAEFEEESALASAG
jgi:hypothetical protein